MLSRTICILLIIFISFTIALGAVPTKIAYQGKLTDTSGVGINDTLPMVFKLYDVENGGIALWTEIYAGADEVPVIGEDNTCAKLLGVLPG